jgi:hypothetical protein
MNRMVLKRWMVLIGLLIPAVVTAQDHAQIFAPGVISTGHEFTVRFTLMPWSA